MNYALVIRLVGGSHVGNVMNAKLSMLRRLKIIANIVLFLTDLSSVALLSPTIGVGNSKPSYCQPLNLTCKIHVQLLLEVECHDESQN